MAAVGIGGRTSGIRSENHLEKELRFHIEQQIADSIARCRDRDESVD